MSNQTPVQTETIPAVLTPSSQQNNHPRLTPSDTTDLRPDRITQIMTNLFEGSAAEWFWRYHQGVSELR